MSEAAATDVAVGDQVRVHFHPPCPMKSFSEGVVRRVDVTTPEGRFFVVEVTHEVILDREHRIRPGFLDYVRYEGQNDFPGRIEILSTTAQDVAREAPTVLRAAQTSEEIEQDTGERPPLELEVHSEAEVESFGAETDHEPIKAEDEHRPFRKQGGLIAGLFGRKK